MHRASREEFLTYVDHLGESGLASRSRLLEERHYPHLAALTDELERQNPNMTERLRERVAKLRTGEAQVVITGQQTGIFGGPLYAIYKLLTCLKVAQQAETTLGRPVVPIFGSRPKITILMRLTMFTFRQRIIKRVKSLSHLQNRLPVRSVGSLLIKQHFLKSSKRHSEQCQKRFIRNN